MQGLLSIVSVSAVGGVTVRPYVVRNRKPEDSPEDPWLSPNDCTGFFEAPDRQRFLRWVHQHAPQDAVWHFKGARPAYWLRTSEWLRIALTDVKDFELKGKALEQVLPFARGFAELTWCVTEARQLAGGTDDIDGDTPPDRHRSDSASDESDFGNDAYDHADSVAIATELADARGREARLLHDEVNRLTAALKDSHDEVERLNEVAVSLNEANAKQNETITKLLARRAASDA
jgi:hypothetical protein